MKNKIFTGKTLEECLDFASSQLNIPKDSIKYEIVEEKKGLFRSKVSISVQFNEEAEKSINGSIKVEKGKIIVKNPMKGGMPAIINFHDEINIIVDGTEISEKKEVYEDSEIEVSFPKNIAQRRMNIRLSPNNMKAFITIEYIPEKVYTLSDSPEVLELSIERKIVNEIYPKAYTVEEIKEELNTNGINFGIIEENIEKCTNMENTYNVLIAEGQDAEDGTSDIINVTFQTEKDKNILEEDNYGRVDYKRIGHVKTVEKGQVLVEKQEGKQGRDGVDVKGIVKKHKSGKKINIQTGEGCEFKDNNTIISTIEGKPSMKGNSFSVHRIHEVRSDVDIKTGNIEFVGDIIVDGSVKEGMEVKAGHDLFIYKNVESAKVSSRGDLEIIGSAISSTVNSGGEDVIILRKIKDLENLNTALRELIGTIQHVKEHNLLGEKVRDGEIIKVLIENKFKYMIEICNDYFRVVQVTSSNEEKKLVSIIKQKLIGAAPLNIKNFSELNIIIKIIESIIKMFSGKLTVPVNMKIGYCQDSTFTSSGDIIITGKGEYVSNISAYERVEFVNPNSVARGGVIKARNEIRCKKVGSEGGVSTKLIVEAQGNIWVDVAYQNTCFIVGGREYTLDVASKDVHAYLNSEGEITVDKFVL